jgi:hypothetical protein
VETLENLTRRAFRHWLLKQSPDRETGFARDPFDCPLARWLHSLGAEQPLVSLETITFDFQGVPYSMPTPSWAADLIAAVDSNASFGEWILSASRALQLLDAALPARVA